MEINKENIYKLENASDVKKFIIGGKAILTLESTKTGRWFTYKIKKAKKDDEKSPFFVSVLTGGDNESAYTYMGTIFNNDRLSFKLTKNSKIGEDALSYKAFNFFFNLLINNDKLHSEMNVYHRGICAVCGRPLTTPESLIIGIGPICDGRLGKPIEIKKVRKKKLQMLNRKLVK